ncbi:MAG: hypothetical protein WD097_06560 [Balneolales bacterium]
MIEPIWVNFNLMASLFSKQFGKHILEQLFEDVNVNAVIHMLRHGMKLLLLLVKPPVHIAPYANFPDGLFEVVMIRDPDILTRNSCIIELVP